MRKMISQLSNGGFSVVILIVINIVLPFDSCSSAFNIIWSICETAYDYIL